MPNRTTPSTPNQPQQFCPSCGAGASVHARVCLSCGAPVGAVPSDITGEVPAYRRGPRPSERRARKLRKLGIVMCVLALLLASVGIALAQRARYPLTCTQASAKDIAQNVIEKTEIVAFAGCVAHFDQRNRERDDLVVAVAPKPARNAAVLSGSAPVSREWRVYRVSNASSGSSSPDWQELHRQPASDHVLRVESATDPFRGDLVEWTLAVEPSAKDVDSTTGDIGYRRLRWVDRGASGESQEPMRPVALDARCDARVSERAIGPDNWSEKYASKGTCGDSTDDGIFDVLVTPDSSGAKSKLVQIFQPKTSADPIRKRRSSDRIWIAATPPGTPRLVAIGARPGVPRRAITYFQWTDGAQMRVAPHPVALERLQGIRQCRNDTIMFVESFDSACDEAKRVVAAAKQKPAPVMLKDLQQPRVVVDGVQWECLRFWRDSTTATDGTMCETLSPNGPRHVWFTSNAAVVRDA